MRIAYTDYPCFVIDWTWRRGHSEFVGLGWVGFVSEDE
jgi:hypothetical protein